MLVDATPPRPLTHPYVYDDAAVADAYDDGLSLGTASEDEPDKCPYDLQAHPNRHRAWTHGFIIGRARRTDGSGEPAVVAHPSNHGLV